jgi:5'-nucleotidase
MQAQPTTSVKTPNPNPKNPTLVVGLSSSALFHTHESDDVYQKQSLKDYVDHQVQRENECFPKGTAFPLAEVMMRLNAEKKPFEIVVMSKNEPAAGSRVMNSLDHYGFENVRAAFTGGEPIAQYCEALGVTLFLSREKLEVKRANKNGIAAGLIYDPPAIVDVEPQQLRVAFDFDGVLASLESELVYQNTKPDMGPYRRHEVEKANIPLPPGPLFPVLKQLSAIKAEMEAARHALFPHNEAPDAKSLAIALSIDVALIEKLIKSGPAEKALFRALDEGRLEGAGFTSEEASLIAPRARAFFSPIEVALVTARNPPAEKRLMKTLRSWGIAVDQTFLLGGKPKEPVLKKFRSHIFFDDQETHTKLACKTVATSLVPWSDEALATAKAMTSAHPDDRAQAPSKPFPSTKILVQFPSAKEFEMACRAVFKPYTIAAGGAPHRLDERFRKFIAVNRARRGPERAAVLTRLKPYDLANLAGTHEPKLSRDRYDLLLQKLDYISGIEAPKPQTEIDFPGSESSK